MADAPSPHGLNSSHHTGTLTDAQAPQFLKTDGTRTLTGNLAVSSGVTVDGVDISVLKNNYDVHLGDPLAHNYIRNLLDDAGVAAPKGVTTNDVQIYGDGTGIAVTKTASGLLISYIGGGGGGGGGGSFSGIKDPAGTGVAPDGLGWILTSDDNVVNVAASGANTLAFSVAQGNITHNNLAGLTSGDPHTQYPLLSGTETISGLWTFSRSTNPPFAVNSGAGKVANLDADKLDGLDSTAFLSPQYLTLATNSNLSNERVLVAGGGLTLTDGGAGGNATLAVGAGTLITVGATTVGITAGANYQFIGTGSGAAAGWRNVSELAGAGLMAATGILAVGAGAGITVNADDVALTTPGSLSASSTNSSSGNHTHAIDSTIARSAITLTAGAGLTGGGDLTANRTFNVGAGTLITVNADDVALSNGTAQYQVPMTGGSPFTPGWTALSTFAGNGLSFSGGQYVIGAGTLITVGATTVGIAAGANYQFIGTGSGAAAGWRNVSELAGAGLVAATGILAVGAGAGITVNADDVALTTPGNVTVSSANSSSGNHTHAVVSSSNPGSAASLLATDGSGRLNVAVLGVGGLPGSSDKFNVTGHATLDSADFDGAVTIDDDLSVVYGGYYPLYVNVNTVTPNNSNVGIMTNTPDAQFALDVNGPIRGEVLVGPHAIQLKDASLIAHFDGPRPYATDYGGFAAGHMGQPATLTGGVIFRPGKFGKAVQVAGSTTNLLTNPSFETNATGWASLSSGTAARSSADAHIGLYSLLCTSGGGQTYVQGAATSISISNQTYTWSAFVKNRDVATGSGIVQLLVYWQGGANAAATVSYTTAYTVADLADWVRLSTQFTPDYSDRTTAHFYVRLYGVTADGQGFYLDGAQLEAKAHLTPYCDGSLDINGAGGHTWSGTAHASTSSRTQAYFSYSTTDLLKLTAGTVGLWVRLASAPTDAQRYLLRSTSGGSDFFISTNAGKWRWRCGDTAYNSTANVTAEAWTHLTMTWSSGGVKFYVNGVLDSSASLSGFSGVGATLTLGASSSSVNGLIDELFITKTAMTANEVRAIYESNAPVFAESSTFSFRSPSRSPVWVDEEGLWMRSLSGNATLGIYAGEATKSWGGLTLYDSDLAIGNSTAGYVHWHSGVDADDSTYYSNPLLQIAARLHVKGNSTIDGSLTIGTGGYIASGATGYNSGTGLWLEYNGGTPRLFVGNAAGNKMTWDGSALTLVGGITATTGAIGGWTIGATTLTGGNATLSSAGKLTLGTSNDVAIVDASDATYRLWVGHAAAGSAPFRVTKGGALTASNADITGAITANSGSIAGALTIGASGGIYQGTGSFGSPTTGLKIWNDSGIGRVAGYNGGAVQWYANTDGKLYAGAGAVTLDASGVSIAAGTGAANRISWTTAGLQKGSVNVQTLANENYLFANASGTDATDAQGRLYLSASPYNVAHKGARIEVYSAVSTSGTLHYGEAHHFYAAAGGSSLLTVDSSGVTTGQVSVDNLRLDGNTFSSLSGAVTIAPLAGQNLNVSLSTTGDFAVNTSQLYVDTSAGYTGIGLTGPEGPLHVQTTSTSVANFLILEGDRNTGDTEVGILFVDRNSVSGGQQVARIWTDRIGASGNFDLVLQGGDQGLGGLQTAGGIRIHGDTGNVLIGTSTNSGYLLDIAGTLRATGAAYVADIRPVSNSTTAIKLANAAGTAVLNVDTSNSRIGIGTTSPGYLLEVAGSTKLGETWVNGALGVNMLPTDPSYKLVVTGESRFYGNLWADYDLDVAGNVVVDGYVARSRTLNQSIAAGGNWDTGITVGADQFWIVRIMTAQTASGNLIDAAVWLIARQNTSYTVQRFGGTSSEHSVSLSSYAIRVTNTSAGTRYHSFSCARFL